MKGFDTKALILFPFLENYNSKNYNYKYQFGLAVNHLVNYLETKSIESHVLYTDDVARILNNGKFIWVSSLSRADSFFASRNCEGMQDALTKPSVFFEDIYNDITLKDPGSQDMKTDERFEMVVRHMNKAVAKIVPAYNIVIHFRFKNKQQYKVASKAGDGKIRINIDANTFIPTCYMGGIEMNACDLLDIPYGNRALDLWEC
ncbi:MAG: hypothetical protein NC548_31455 [Lachnospiraceae bacterium]|nr:hypothetical protein [Lachnospiraceae bacterium]